MAETERSNLPIAEEPEFTTEIPAIRPDDLVHFAQMNAMLESLLGNDVFLQRLANKMIENSLIAHVLDCENPQMVLGADQAPVITGLIDGVKEDVTQLYSEITTPEGYIFVYDYQDGKFGYNTSTTRGADTFHPFRNGGDEEVARSKLYAAMQYSGKVNSSMTFDYMCQILSEMFSPWDKFIFRQNVGGYYNGAYADGTYKQYMQGWTNDIQRPYVGSGMNPNGMYYVTTSHLRTAGSFNYLALFSANAPVPVPTSAKYLCIDYAVTLDGAGVIVMDIAFTPAKLTSISAVQSNGRQLTLASGGGVSRTTATLDISAISGELYFAFNIRHTTWNYTSDVYIYNIYLQ